VRLRSVENHIVVERGAKRISVYHGETQLLSEPVAVGTDDSPTPTELLPRLHRQTGHRRRALRGLPAQRHRIFRGLSEFGGGVGQIALHGTNQPELIGTPASHGCVRMTNPVVEQVVSLAPIGTPVDIYPEWSMVVAGAVVTRSLGRLEFVVGTGITSSVKR